MRELLRHLVETLAGGGRMLVCQVVETKGSTPQKAGAWMLVAGDGTQLGTLGGGCVEAEVKQHALRRLDQPGGELLSYVLDHDYAWADGLVCGGKMVILAECAEGPGALAYLTAYLRVLEAGQGHTEVIAVDPERCGARRVGSRFLFDATGASVACWPDATPPAAILEGLDDLASRPRPRVNQGAAYLPCLPRVRLVIVGAGHVGQAVGALAAQADFDICVVDDRRQYANTDRFPFAQEIHVGPITEILRGLTYDEHTYALVVTRGHGHDQEALESLAPTGAGYVGLIGSRRKIRLIFEALVEQGIREDDLARVAAPVGLDIGSESVPEIAVSIVAELIARRNLGPESLTPRGWFEPAASTGGDPPP